MRSQRPSFIMRQGKEIHQYFSLTFSVFTISHCYCWSFKAVLSKLTTNWTYDLYHVFCVRTLHYHYRLVIRNISFDRIWFDVTRLSTLLSDNESTCRECEWIVLDFIFLRHKEKIENINKLQTKSPLTLREIPLKVWVIAQIIFTDLHSDSTWHYSKLPQHIIISTIRMVGHLYRTIWNWNLCEL